MPTAIAQTATSDTLASVSTSHVEETTRFDAAFEQLLVAWNRHQDLRYSESSLDQLLRSRNELDERRRHARAARRTLV